MLPKVKKTLKLGLLSFKTTFKKQDLLLHVF